MENGIPKFLGLFPSEETALKSVKAIEDAGMYGWNISNIMLIGYVFSTDTGRILENSDPLPHIPDVLQ